MTRRKLIAAGRAPLRPPLVASGRECPGASRPAGALGRSPLHVGPRPTTLLRHRRRLPARGRPLRRMCGRPSPSVVDGSASPSRPPERNACRAEYTGPEATVRCADAAYHEYGQPGVRKLSPQADHVVTVQIDYAVQHHAGRDLRGGVQLHSSTTDGAGTAEGDAGVPCLYDRLGRLDWTFASAYTRGETHAVHPYPAKFIPQLPRELIASLYPKDGTAVLDPFCGSGTTLVEAALAGAPAVGVDLHPLACLISKVKVTPLQRSLVDAADSALRRAAETDDSPPPIPALDHWFKPVIQRSLAALVRAIDQEADEDVRDALRVAMSSIVVRVSNQDGETRYAAVEKTVGAASVHDGFREAAAAIDRALVATWAGFFPPAPVRVIHRNVLDVQPGDVGVPVSLVITSPPYPNAFEYWLYHKYRMFWLGMDPIAVRTEEIGARPHYFKRNPHTADDFERQMTQVFGMLAGVMVEGGHACYVVGDSIIRGETIDNAALLERAADRHGFRLEVSVARRIPSSRKAFNPKNARLQEERLLVFRLVGR